MVDEEPGELMRKPPQPVTCAEMGIESVTKFRTMADPFTSREPRNFGGNARLIPISLSRVRWLDRPLVEEEEADGE